MKNYRITSDGVGGGQATGYSDYRFCDILAIFGDSITPFLAGLKKGDKTPLPDCYQDYLWFYSITRL